MNKFLDEKGVQHLWSKISMEDYPNNETLIAVLNAIDETKANKDDTISVDGGGSLTLEDIFGEPPYTIEVTDELEELQNVVVAAGSDYGTYRLRNVAIVTEIPTQMNDGDIALVIKQEG